MSPFQKGKRISADALNKSAATARQGANIVGLGAEQSPGGNTITLPPPVIPDNNLIRCRMAGNDAVAYGVVEIFDGWGLGGINTAGTCRIPSQSGFGRIGAIQKGVGVNTAAEVQFQGIGWVRFDLTTVPATYQTRTGYRLGGFKDSHIAEYDQLGPMLVKKDLGVIEGFGRIALVEFTGRRGDNKIADDPDDVYAGPYETYIWDSTAYTVAQSSAGVISVELA